MNIKRFCWLFQSDIRLMIFEAKFYLRRHEKILLCNSNISKSSDSKHIYTNNKRK